MITHCALMAGWQPTVCDEAAAAQQCAEHWIHHLVIVDLPPHKATATKAFRRLVERVTEISRALLVVCGSSDDSRQEVWARRLGVWMYLPGLDAESDLSLVFQAARGALGRASRVRLPAVKRPWPHAGRTTWGAQPQAFRRPPHN